MRKHIYLLFPLLTSVLLTLGISPLGSISFSWKAIVAITVFATATWYFLSRNPGDDRNKWRVLMLAIPPIALYLPIHISDFWDTALALPSSISHILGIVLGILFVRVKKYHAMTTGLILTASSVYSFPLQQNWSDRLQFRNLNVEVLAETKTILLTDQVNQDITTVVLNKPIVVLDFWNTGCGVCVKKFPALEEVHLIWNQDPDVAIYSVNVPMKRDSIGDAEKFIAQKGYHFPIIYCTSDNFFNTFGLNSFPSILIIRKNEGVESCADIATLNDRLAELKGELEK